MRLIVIIVVLMCLIVTTASCCSQKVQIAQSNDNSFSRSRVTFDCKSKSECCDLDGCSCFTCDANQKGSCQLSGKKLIKIWLKLGLWAWTLNLISISLNTDAKKFDLAKSWPGKKSNFDAVKIFFTSIGGTYIFLLTNIFTFLLTYPTLQVFMQCEAYYRWMNNDHWLINGSNQKNF